MSYRVAVRGGFCLRIEKAQFKGEKSYRLVLLRDKCEIVEEVLLFSNYLISQGFSLNTADSYVRDLKVFFNYLDAKSLDYKDVQPINIGWYIEYLNGYEPNKIRIENVSKRAIGTINRMLAAVSAFYKYCELVIKDVKSPFIMTGTKRPQSMYRGLLYHAGHSEVSNRLFKLKTPKQLKRRLFPDEVENFRSELKSLRDKLIFDILYEGGLRIGELLGLQINDYSEPNPEEVVGELYVVYRPENKRDAQAKTGSRVVHLPMPLIYEIESYITEHRPYKKGANTLFVALKGKSKGESLERSTIEKNFHECSLKTGILCTPHMLRHTHITELGEAGYDVKFIKERVGHADINTTMKYTHLSVQSLKDAYKRYYTSKRGEV